MCFADPLQSRDCHCRSVPYVWQALAHADSHRPKRPHTGSGVFVWQWQGYSSLHKLVPVIGLLACMQITAYRAGHVLGAAMFMVEIAGMRLLYTGDYSRIPDRHLSAADLPEQRPDIGKAALLHTTHIHAASAGCGMKVPSVWAW